MKDVVLNFNIKFVQLQVICPHCAPISRYIYSKTATKDTYSISNVAIFGPCAGHYHTYAFFGTID